VSKPRELWTYGELLALPEGTHVCAYDGAVWRRESCDGVPVLQSAASAERDTVVLSSLRVGTAPFAPYLAIASPEWPEPVRTPLPGESWKRAGHTTRVRVDALYLDGTGIPCVAYSVTFNEFGSCDRGARTVEEFTTLYVRREG